MASKNTSKKKTSIAKTLLLVSAYTEEPLIIEDEVRQALRSLAKKKATGIDDIAMEYFTILKKIQL